MGFATHVVGRDDLVDQVLRTLTTSGGCLIFGPGGVGKTTIAHAVARRFGVVQWVDAETLRRPAAVLAALQDQLDPLPLPGESSSASALAGRPVLVVVDGADEIADHLGAVVRELPVGPEGPWLLVASRVRPRDVPLPLVRIPPLLCEAASSGEAPSAVTLFVRRYREAGGDRLDLDDDVVRTLTVMTGGLPAAIGIVAARTALVGFEDVPSTLAAADVIVEEVVSQSLARLTPDAAAMLLAIGASAGTAPRSLVAALSALPAERMDTAITELARHGLVTAVGGGLAMLPPVRRSVRRLAQRDGTAATVAGRHLQWCRDLVAQDRAPGHLAAAGAELAHAMSRTATTPGGFADAVDLAVALAGDRTTTLQHRGGHELLSELIDLAEPLESHAEPAAAVRLLIAAARMGSLVHGVGDSLRLLDRAEAILASDAVASDPPVAPPVTVRHRAGIARTRAQLAFDMGDLPLAGLEAERARDLARLDEDEAVALEAETCLAQALLESGRIEAAERLAEQVAARAGDIDGLGWLHGLARQVSGFAALDRGAVSRARSIALLELDRCHRRHERDGALEALFLLVAADPVGGAEPADTELATVDAGAWILHLQLQRARVARWLLAGDARSAAMAAADAAIVAATMPHRFEQIEATLLLGDASSMLGDRAQALEAYDTALTDAIRYGSVLRAADALDGWATALALTRDDAGSTAAAAAAEVRRVHGARRRPRPWLSVPRASSPVPDGWVVDGRATVAAAAALREVGLRRAAPPGDGLGMLSRSERVVAGLVAEGCTNREISERLVISRRTVETHVAHAFQKLHVRTRAQLASLVTRATVAD